MKKNLLFSLICGALFVPATAMAELAPTTCGTDWGNSTHGSRGLESLTVKGGVDGDVQISGFDTWSTHKVYSDLTEQVVKATAGANMSIKANSTKTVEWSHGYIYIDFNNDGEFTVNVDTETGLINEGSELLSYSYYGVNDDVDNWGFDSTGQRHEGAGSNRGKSILDEGRIPAFSLPADLADGQYRMRFKMDWNSLDACGNDDPNNLIGNNGGYIIDFTLQVGEVNTVDAVKGEGVALYYNDGAIYTNAEGEVTIYNITGKLVKKSLSAPVAVDELPNGVYIVKAGGKAVKFVK